MRGPHHTQAAPAIAIKAVTATAQKMYIEVTTIAIPTVLITALKIAGFVVAAWFAICIIVGLFFYHSN